MDSRNIFWGLIIKPGKRYETEVQEPFRITKVSGLLLDSINRVFISCFIHAPVPFIPRLVLSPPQPKMVS